MARFCVFILRFCEKRARFCVFILDSANRRILTPQNHKNPHLDSANRRIHPKKSSFLL
ncbi:hypothetical protein [Helicobacter sp. 23-1045]